MITINVMSNDAKLDKIIIILKSLERKMSVLQEEIDALTTQVTKIVTEIQNLKTTLEAQIAALEAQIATGATADLTALKATVQQIDDIVPDAVVV